jgi:hypothetical protein
MSGFQKCLPQRTFWRPDFAIMVSVESWRCVKGQWTQSGGTEKVRSQALKG